MMTIYGEIVTIKKKIKILTNYISFHARTHKQKSIAKKKLKDATAELKDKKQLLRDRIKTRSHE